MWFFRCLCRFFHDQSKYPMTIVVLPNLHLLLLRTSYTMNRLNNHLVPVVLGPQKECAERKEDRNYSQQAMRTMLAHLWWLTDNNTLPKLRDAWWSLRHLSTIYYHLALIHRLQTEVMREESCYTIQFSQAPLTVLKAFHNSNNITYTYVQVHELSKKIYHYYCAHYYCYLPSLNDSSVPAALASKLHNAFSSSTLPSV